MRKGVEKRRKSSEENIYNIPNSLTLLRVIIAFIIIYFIFADARIELIVGLFIVGMITDGLDGFIARRFNMKTEFGRKFDVLADRFLLGATVVSLLIGLGVDGVLTRQHMFLILLVLSRELISLPVAIVALSSGRAVPQVKFIGKLTTVCQAIAFPAVVLYIYYPKPFWFAVYLALITCVCGVIAGFTYIFDIMQASQHHERTRKR